MKKSLTCLCLLGWLLTVSTTGSSPPGVFEASGPPPPLTPLDEPVVRRRRELGLDPARPCADAVVLRRVYLDALGTLPTAAEARAFLNDRSPQKRRALVDRLLDRPEFADYWTMKWGELLRVKSEYPVNLWPNAVQAYHRWIHTALRENRSYDRFARELLTASGSNFREAPVNFYRAVQNREPAGLAQAVALTFLGTRLEVWPAERRDGLAACFARVGYKSTLEWKEEIVFFDRDRADAPRTAILPDGTSVELPSDRDPRGVFADWLIRPDNPWFARALVNRVWSWLLGRGIVHEPDDLRPGNPPVNAELLAWLEAEFVRSGYDLKALYRVILNSATYQLSPVPQSTGPVAEANFAFHPLRPLEAEVLIDALNQITGTTEKYSSPIPEPFTFLPDDQRAVTLPDGSIGSSFLELFGRPSRDTGRETERVLQPTDAQRLHLLNSSHVQRKLEQSPKLRSLIQAGRKPGEAVTGLYLAILSRFPTAAELRAVAAYTQSGGGASRETALDLAWALINSAEFLNRH